MYNKRPAWLKGMHIIVSLEKINWLFFPNNETNLVFSPSRFLRNLNIKNLETTILVAKLLISTYRPKISSSQTVSLTFTMIPSQGFFSSDN